MNRNERAARLAVLVLLPTAALALAAPAQAHVTLRPAAAAAGSTTTLELAFEHGCDGSATTSLAVRLPDGVTDVTPVDDPRWEVSTTPAPGATVTFRAVTPIPDGSAASAALTVALPDEDGVLVFPTVQGCVDGENAWLEATADGAGEDSLELPAPTLTVGSTEAEDERGGAGLAVGVVGVGVLGTAVVGGVLARQRRRS